MCDELGTLQTVKLSPPFPSVRKRVCKNVARAPSITTTVVANVDPPSHRERTRRTSHAIRWDHPIENKIAPIHPLDLRGFDSLQRYIPPELAPSLQIDFQLGRSMKQSRYEPAIHHHDQCHR